MNSTQSAQVEDLRYLSNLSIIVNHTANQDGLYDVPLHMIVGLSVIYGLISFSAISGNSLVLWIIITVKHMQTSTNTYIANLALADVIIGSLAVPCQFQAALLQRWELPEFLCSFCPFAQVASVNASVFTLSAIAIDRYRAIMLPLKAIQSSKRRAMYTVLVIWLVSISLALPQKFDFSLMQIEDIGEGKTKPFCAPVLLNRSFHTYYNISLPVMQYLMPFLLLVILYSRLGFHLLERNIPGNKEQKRDLVALREKKRIVKMLALVVILFGICWLPLQLYNFLQSITRINEYQYINVIWFCSRCLAMSNSCYNPFVYAVCSEKFQKEYKNLMCGFWRKSLTNYLAHNKEAFENPITANQSRSLVYQLEGRGAKTLMATKHDEEQKIPYNIGNSSTPGRENKCGTRGSKTYIISGKVLELSENETMV